MAVRQLEKNGQQKWRDWPLYETAAARLGCSVRTLRRAVSNDEINVYADPDGMRRFNPLELEDYGTRRDRGGEPADEDEATQRRRDEIEDATRSGDLAAVLLREAVEFNRSMQSHLESMMKLVLGPMQQNHKQSEALIAALTGRLGSLEARSDEMIKAREQLLDRQHERALAEESVRNWEEKKKEAFGLLMKQAPDFLEAVKVSAIAGDPEMLDRVSATAELLSTLDEATMQGLKEAGIVDEKQGALIDRILKGYKRPEPPADDATEPASEPAAQPTPGGAETAPEAAPAAPEDSEPPEGKEAPKGAEPQSSGDPDTKGDTTNG